MNTSLFSDGDGGSTRSRGLGLSGLKKRLASCDRVDGDETFIEAGDVNASLVAVGAGLSDEEAMAITAVFGGDHTHSYVTMGVWCLAFGGFVILFFCYSFVFGISSANNINI
jgi:hypothetical protein